MMGMAMVRENLICKIKQSPVSHSLRASVSHATPKSCLVWNLLSLLLILNLHHRFTPRCPAPPILAGPRPLLQSLLSTEVPPASPSPDLALCCIFLSPVQYRAWLSVVTLLLMEKVALGPLSQPGPVFTSSPGAPPSWSRPLTPPLPGSPPVLGAWAWQIPQPPGPSGTLGNRPPEKTAGSQVADACVKFSVVCPCPVCLFGIF